MSNFALSIDAHNPHAFKTLSVIYDEKGDTEKSLQVCLFVCVAFTVYC